MRASASSCPSWRSWQPRRRCVPHEREGDPRRHRRAPGCRRRADRDDAARDPALPANPVDVGSRMHRTKVKVVADALDANNTIARANREDFDRHGVAVVNLMSAPGAGKTRLLERALADLDGVRAGVLEGDVAGSFDADRLSLLHIPVVQLNTGAGFGGECHLDANMVRSAIPSLPLAELDLLVIENVGNLVCPAEFRVGENARIMVCSVTEGEDKPLKYPLMFRACELVVINKIDLLPHLDFDLDRLVRNVETVNPDADVMLVSAKTGEGVDAWRTWLGELAA